jgi:hypothetical protein
MRILCNIITPFSFLNRRVKQKYDSLMSIAPAVDFDCSGIYDPRLLLDVVAHAAGRPAASLPPAFSTLTPSSAAAATVQSINLGHNWMSTNVSVKLQEQLHRFSALQHVNVSVNPTLGSAGVTAILSSLAGVYH